MPWLQPGGTLDATSFYDTSDLKHTLERLVDFDRLNAGMTRFSLTKHVPKSEPGGWFSVRPGSNSNQEAVYG